MAENKKNPVSYTHLDVYKRQGKVSTRVVLVTEGSLRTSLAQNIEVTTTCVRRTHEIPTFSQSTQGDCRCTVYTKVLKSSR